jgi:hypothetical protein
MFPGFIYKPSKEHEEAAIDEHMFYEPLLNDWNNQAEAVFDSFFNYPIDAGAFLLNLLDIATAQQEDPLVT